MTITSRKTSRKALATLLEAELVGADKPTQAVTAYPPRGITTSPLAFVRSSKTKVKRQGIGQTNGHNWFRLEILVYVVAASAQADGPDPEESADALDDIEASVRKVILTNPTNAAWLHLETVEEGSQVYRLNGSATGGKPYDVEIIPVEVEVYDT